MMTKRFLIIAGIVFLSCTALFAEGQDKHPYLFFTKTKVERLKDRMSSDTLVRGAWQRMKARADRSVQSGKGGDMRELALVYQVTADQVYARRAKELLKPVLEKKAWDGLDDRTPRWNAALGTAHTLEVVSNTFDAIYETLSVSERKYMAGRIVELGIKPALGDWIWEPTRIHTLNSMGHNWWSSIVFQAGVACLAVKNEVPQAEQWAKDVMTDSRQFFAFAGSVLENKPANFDPDGGFYESINYANFGVAEYLFFRLAYTHTFGKLSMPYDPLLEKTMDWFVHNCYPNTGELVSVNFGDGGPQVTGERPVKLMIELGFDKPSYRWYLEQVGNDNDFREGLNVNTALGLVYQPQFKVAPQDPELPVSATYQDMGWATLRSSWDKNATMLAIKSGYTWNHAHADAGSFILYHNGENLLIDGGNVSYGNPAYSNYSVTSQAHNVVLFNGQAQNPQDQYHAVKNPGHLYHLIDGGDFKYILADATGPTSQYFLRNYRNFLWVGNVLLVVDDLKAYDYGKFDWLLHYDGEARKKGIDIDISKGNAGVIVRPLFPETLPNGYPHDFPEKMRLEERMGIKDHHPDVQVPYYAFSPVGKYQQTKFITAIILLDEENKEIKGPQLSAMASAKEARQALPVIEKLEGKDYIGVKITQSGKTTEVYFNLTADGRLMHRNSHNLINGFETDAYMTAWTYPANQDKPTEDNLESFFVSNGSYLRYQGKSLLSSLSKVFMYTEKKGTTAHVILQGQPLIHTTLGLKGVKQVVLNEKEIKAGYSDKGLELDINTFGK